MYRAIVRRSTEPKEAYVLVLDHVVVHNRVKAVFVFDTPLIKNRNIHTTDILNITYAPREFELRGPHI